MYDYFSCLAAVIKVTLTGPYSSPGYLLYMYDYFSCLAAVIKVMLTGPYS